MIAGLLDLVIATLVLRQRQDEADQFRQGSMPHGLQAREQPATIIASMKRRGIIPARPEAAGRFCPDRGGSVAHRWLPFEMRPVPAAKMWALGNTFQRAGNIPVPQKPLW